MKYIVVTFTFLLIIDCNLSAQNKVDTAHVLEMITSLSEEMEEDSLQSDYIKYYLRATYYYAVGNFIEAKKDCEKFIYLYSKVYNFRATYFGFDELVDADFLYDNFLLLGWLENYFEKPDEGINYYHKAIQLDSLKSEPFFYLGYIYMNKGDTAKACDFFNKAKQLNTKTFQYPLNCK